MTVSGGERPEMAGESPGDKGSAEGVSPAEIEALHALQHLPGELVEEMARQSVIRAWPRGARVLAEGEPVVEFQVVVSGRLTVEHAGRVVAHLERGDTFGQLSLIAGLPAMVTVTVRHDCRILAVPAELFRRALGSSPQFAASSLQRSAARLTALSVPRDEPGAPGLTTILAVYSAPAGVGKTSFAINLAAAMRREAGAEAAVALVEVAEERKGLLPLLGFGAGLPLVQLRTVEIEGRDILKEKGKHHAAGFDVLRVAHRPDRPDDAEAVAPLLSALSRRCRYLIIDLPPRMNEAVWTFLSHADVRMVLTSPEPRHLDQTANLLEKTTGEVMVFVTRATPEVEDEAEAIGRRLGRPVAEFLAELPDADRVAVTARPESRYAGTVRRIARRQLGTLTGLALSGGAARGTSHIGVLRVLEEEGLFPDVLAGTSIGALVGGMWSGGRSAGELAELAHQTRRRDLFGIIDLAFPPSPALMRGRLVEKFISRGFGDRRFADLRWPFRVVAADIDTAEEVVFSTGRVRDAVRASIAIPGVLRPVVIGGRRLFDGAVVTPLPVGVLRAMGCTRILAVNAIASLRPTSGGGATVRPPGLDAGAPWPDSVMQSDGPAPGMAEFAVDGLERAAAIPLVRQFLDLSPDAVPNVLDIIGRSNIYMQSRIAEGAARGASVVVRPWVPELGWLDFDSAPRFIRAGENAARAVLPEIRKLWGK